MHQFRDKKEIKRKKRLTRVIIILVLFLVLSFSGILGVFSKFFNYVGRPIWESKKVAVSEVNDIVYLFKNKKNLLLENEKIKEENSNLKIRMIDYQILKDENNKLKELLGRIPSKHNFILGSILSKPNNSPYDTLVIDIGENDDIQEGLMVYINGNVPIGIIDKVYPKTALVLLYSNPGKVTDGVIEGSNINVSLTGRGGGNFEMSIPFEIVVSNGTMITLPDIESEVLAIVEEDISNPTDPIKKIILRSPVNIQNEKWVEVKKN